MFWKCSEHAWAFVDWSTCCWCLAVFTSSEIMNLGHLRLVPLSNSRQTPLWVPWFPYFWSQQLLSETKAVCAATKITASSFKTKLGGKNFLPSLLPCQPFLHSLSLRPWHTRPSVGHRGASVALDFAACPALLPIIGSCWRLFGQWSLSVRKIILVSLSQLLT